MNEEWKTIPGIETHEVSSIGRVRNKKRGNILKNHLTPNGYYYARFNKQTRTVNYLVCLAFNGPAPTPNHQAAHNNGAKTDNRPDNLRWLTRIENYQDQILHGTSKRGEGHHMHKLTEGDVIAIRSLSGTVLQKEIGEMFSVNATAISRVINKKRWGHV